MGIVVTASPINNVTLRPAAAAGAPYFFCFYSSGCLLLLPVLLLLPPLLLPLHMTTAAAAAAVAAAPPPPRLPSVDAPASSTSTTASSSTAAAAAAAAGEASSSNGGNGGVAPTTMTISFVVGTFRLGEPWGEAALRACIEGLAGALHPPLTGERLWAQLVTVPPHHPPHDRDGTTVFYGGALPRPLRVHLCAEPRRHLFSEVEKEEGDHHNNDNEEWAVGALCLTAVDIPHRLERPRLLFAGELRLELSDRRWCPSCASLDASPLFRLRHLDEEGASRTPPAEVTVRLPCLHPLLLHQQTVEVEEEPEEEGGGLLVMRAGRGAHRAVSRAVGSFKTVFNLL
jgi:hypothetical protein